jgi:hypothetical protein
MYTTSKVQSIILELETATFPACVTGVVAIDNVLLRFAVIQQIRPMSKHWARFENAILCRHIAQKVEKSASLTNASLTVHRAASLEGLYDNARDNGVIAAE